jgi:hypothetical protein
MYVASYRMRAARIYLSVEHAPPPGPKNRNRPAASICQRLRTADRDLIRVERSVHVKLVSIAGRLLLLPPRPLPSLVPLNLLACHCERQA